MGNLWEWFGRNMWLAWALVAGGLALLELLTLDLTLLMLAAGAAAASITALFVPTLWWLQLAVAVVVAFFTLGVLRPTLLEKVRNAPGYRNSLDTLMGAAGVVTQPISPHSEGEVKVDGQLWAARPFAPDVSLTPGSRIEVFDRDGLTLLVHPVDHAQITTTHEGT